MLGRFTGPYSSVTPVQKNTLVAKGLKSFLLIYLSVQYYNNTIINCVMRTLLMQCYSCAKKTLFYLKKEKNIFTLAI